MSARRRGEFGLMAGAGICSQQGASMPMLVLVISVILMTMGVVALRITTNDIRASGHAKAAVEILYLAEAGVARAKAVIAARDLDSLLAKVDSTRSREDQVSQMGSDTALRVFTDTIAFGAGWYKVKLFDNNDGDGNQRADADNKVFVRSVGILRGGVEKTVEALFAKQASPTVSSEGAIVAAGPVETLGNLTVDGRNHDINGNLIGGTGTKAISTRKTYNRGGNSKVGGTDDFGTNRAPSKNAADVAAVTEQGQTFPEPASPDAALGLADGTLKAYAQSGAGGSQYVTDPASLTMPLSGVTYVDLPCGGTWQSMDFGASSGIVVVHSPCKDGVIKNLNGGTLKGILIADDIVHIHNTIIGQIIQISGAPSSGNCIGNGSGDILYSAAAVSNALSSLSNQVFMTAWREL